MELSEALEIIEATVAMFQEFSVNKVLSMKLCGEDFMLTPVIRSYENCYDDEAGEIVRKEMIYYAYDTNDGKKKEYLEDIRPVCKLLIDEWPSRKTRRLRDFLIDTRSQCYEYGIGLLDDEDLTLATTGKEEFRVAFSYNKRLRRSYNIRTFVMDTLFEICRAIRVTEDEEEKTDTIMNFPKDIAIIDEIEASLHPEVQKRIYESYKKSHKNKSGTKPTVLCTEEAEPYWQLLKKAGFVGDDCRLLPETSRKQAMLIAELFAEKLSVKAKWKTFQEFWDIKNLAQEKWDYQQTGISPARQQEIMDIFEK